MVPTYGERSGLLPHCSFFRKRLAARARQVPPGLDPVEEYLIDQANLRGFLGAFSDRADLGARDPELSLEAIIVGLLQPHAPADLRVVKLVVRMLQRGLISVERLIGLAKQERALPMLAWIVELVPPEERTGAIPRLAGTLAEHPPRESRRPRIRYAPSRLRRRTA